ncbi:tRNA (guanosine(46)-N7)-methyltransferase TrmB [Phragmitibacter flavus]|uniref:tRNA (guanine-N(7)-)-methyltransferase n=1 Tax=Phragmitibacter flavus TaxID=2576071 RepID=A0A5R8KJD0_9BACT|nr:tRNA (guanosine(46)-N7)-methyltransferase TrmB [Phragmitibacter flavus]TLD72367.1 tRNA (guanosine(46)-N7)-methyltransferase TrmB [Phragmitibacter flavus]
MSDDFLFTPDHYFRELRKEEIFPASAEAPLEVDLGCGEGHFIAGMADLFPDRNFLAVERLQGRVKNTVRKLRESGLKNGKVLRLETAYTVAWLLPTAGVSRVHLLCPDPWPKKKHHARRLVNRVDFLNGLHRVLEVGGEFLLKTDDTEYFENAMESMSTLAVDQSSGQELFERLEWDEEAFPYPQTGFERHWLGMGRSIHRARWRKC